MGRFGSIFGSAIGGALLGFGWQFGAILAMLAIPATLAAIAILVSQRVSAGETTASPNAAH
jgi:AAHS family 4-hydroxybenzoate transporter-like MFS transporter